MTDPIADYLTRIRNAIKANKRIVEIPSSNIKKEMTKVLFDKGFILNYKFEEDKYQDLHLELTCQKLLQFHFLILLVIIFGYRL